MTKLMNIVERLGANERGDFLWEELNPVVYHKLHVWSASVFLYLVERWGHVSFVFCPAKEDA